MHQRLAAISDAIFGYIADKLVVDSGAIIFDDAAIHLSEKGVAMETIEGLRKILDNIDAARFSPESSKIEIADIIENSENLLKEMDRALRT